MNNSKSRQCDALSSHGQAREFSRANYNLLGQTYDEWNIPDGFVAYDIFHAFCAKSGYYDYADYPVDTADGIRDNWYTTLEFYEQGGYYAY